MTYGNLATVPELAESSNWVLPGWHRETKAPPEWAKPARYVFSTNFSAKSENFILSKGKDMATLLYSPRNRAWQEILDIDQKNSFLAQYKVTVFLNDVLREGHFQLIDAAMESFEIEKASPSLLISILSSTIPARPQLPSRQLFFERVQTSLERRGKLKPGLLDGLQ